MSMETIMTTLATHPILGNTIVWIPNWQWLALFFIILFGHLISSSLVYGIHTTIEKLLKRQSIKDEEIKTAHLHGPMNLIFIGWFWLLGLYVIGFSGDAKTTLTIAAKVMTYVGIFWTTWRLTDILNHYLVRKAKTTTTKFDDLLAPLICRSIKLLIVALALISVAEILHLPISSLLAGVGIGGIAIAMAAKETIANLFGSVTILVDRPFNIGDWVIINEHEGSVEDLGFRSTRIRTFYNSLITIPNSVLLTASVDNMGERQFRRIKTTLGLTYDTSPDKVDNFCKSVRQIITAHPHTRKDYFMVYFNGFSESSLDILLYCFLEVKDWEEELQQKHNLFLQIMKAAEDNQVSFAFPTQTLFVHKEENV